MNTPMMVFSTSRAVRFEGERDGRPSAYLCIYLCSSVVHFALELQPSDSNPSIQRLHRLELLPTMYPSTPFHFWTRIASNFHRLPHHHVRLPTNPILQSISPIPQQTSTFSTSPVSLAKGVRQKVDRRISTPLPLPLCPPFLPSHSQTNPHPQP